MKPLSRTWRQTGAFAVFALTLVTVGCFTGGGSLGYGNRTNKDPRSVMVACSMLVYTSAESVSPAIAELESILADAGAEARPLTDDEYARAARLLAAPNTPKGTRPLCFPVTTVQHYETGILTAKQRDGHVSREVSLNVSPSVLNDGVLRVAISLTETIVEGEHTDRSWTFDTTFTLRRGAIGTGQQLGVSADGAHERAILLIRPVLITNEG